MALENYLGKIRIKVWGVKGDRTLDKDFQWGYTVYVGNFDAGSANAVLANDRFFELVWKYSWNHQIEFQRDRIDIVPVDEVESADALLRKEAEDKADYLSQNMGLKNIGFFNA